MDQEHQQQIDTALYKLKLEIPELVAVIKFGAFGTPNETPDSDLDLAVLFYSRLDGVALWNLSQKIAVGLKRDVDLIDLKLASTVFKFQILSTGILVDCANQKVYDLFESTVFSMYLRFKEGLKNG